jgi:diguanylate cyclase (GGDEF)-like protein
MATSRSERFVPQSIRGRVLSLALLPLLVSLSVSLLLFILLTVPEIMDDQKEQLRQTVIAQREFVFQWREERFTDLRFLSALLRLPGDEQLRRPPEASLFLRQQDEFTNILVYGTDGYPIDDQGEEGVYIGDRAYFRRALRGEEAFSEILIGRISRIPVVVFARPVLTADNRIEQILVATVPIASILDALEKGSSVAEGRSLIVAGDGRIMTDEVLMPLYEQSSRQGAFPLELLWERPGARVLPEVMDDIKRGIRTAGPYRNRHGDLIVAAYATVIFDEWYLITESPVEAVFESLRAYLFAGVGTILLFLLLFLPLLVLVSRTIERPIMDLAAFSREINRETYDTDVFPRLPRNAPREIRALFATFSEMVIRLRSHMRELERSAITDPLSGLANRRFLLAEGQRIVAMCLEHRRPVSLLMIDIDFFKRINDEYGHDVGDRAIQVAATTISAATRETDLTARYGGEEFTVVAPFADSEEALTLAERIRLASAEGSGFSTGSGSPNVERFTVSIGVASVDDARLEAVERGHERRPHQRAEELLDALIERADDALYQAKREGRDRVVLAS